MTMVEIEAGLQQSEMVAEAVPSLREQLLSEYEGCSLDEIRAGIDECDTAAMDIFERRTILADLAGSRRRQDTGRRVDLGRERTVLDKIKGTALARGLNPRTYTAHWENLIKDNHARQSAAERQEAVGRTVLQLGE